MKVSIITVCFNSEKTIAQTIESVLNQTYHDIEYIIIDGKSADGTVNVIKEYVPLFGEKIKWVSEKDKGLYDAMNKGIKVSSGDIIGILNSDDVYYDNRVIENVVSMIEESQADVLYSNIEFFKEVQGRDIIVRKWIARTGKVRFGWIPPHPGVFVKKEVYEKLGGYDISLDIAADYDFLFRIFSDKHLKTIYYNNYTVKMRVGGKSMGSLRNIIKGNNEIYKSLKARKVPFPGFITFLRFARKLHQFAFRKLQEEDT